MSQGRKGDKEALGGETEGRRGRNSKGETSKRRTKKDKEGSRVGE